MDTLHRLLRRQLKRQFGEASSIPEEWKSFVDDVNRAYFEADLDREMLERSLDLSSQELFQANSEMRALFQAIPDLFYRTDLEGRILSVKIGSSRELMQHPGLQVGDLIQGLPAKELGSLYAGALRQVKAEKAPVTLEYSLGPQGRQQFYEARLVPLMEDQIVVIIRNITEKRRLEEQFRQAQKMDAFGQLAGGVAHDFNNLLTVIQGNVSMVQAGLLSEDETIQAIDETLRATQRASNLTRQLLTFSRRQPIRLSTLDLNEVVAGMTKMLHRIIGEHINLVNRFSSGSALVRADTGLLEQALLNLAVNSRDAMPGGGTLSIETEQIILTEADLSADKPGRRVGAFIEVSVSDTGVGIPQEHMIHLFEPFFTTKEVGKGTGLGLATVFSVVEQHSGWIEVESHLGQGTVFRIFIPQLPGDAVVAQEQVPKDPEVLGGNETILLVEDEFSVRNLVTRWLERKGYKVITANSGPHALEVWELNKKDIDLLITDMVMPEGMSGRELVARLIAEKPSLRIIQCSGYTPEVLAAQSPLSEETDFIEKPFDRLPFLRRVRACLDAGR